MIISYIKKIMVLLGILSPFCTAAQEDLTAFFEPKFAVNHKVSDRYKIHFATSARNYVFREAYFTLSVRQFQLVHFSTLHLNSNHQLSAGVMFRFRDIFEDHEILIPFHRMRMG